MKKKKLIIDTDIGTDFDDAFAVLLAGVSEEVDFSGCNDRLVKST